MEKVKQDAFDNARLQVIKDGYERAFECLNEGLTADEAGDKARAEELYKRGRQHLLRATSVPSQGEECVGSSWESARQMQQKMQETLNNITTRLAMLETSSNLGSAPALNAGSASDPGATDMSADVPYPGLPTKTKPEMPAPPNPLSANGQAAGAVGGMSACCTEGLPLLLPRHAPAEQPPAYSPQAADGHLSISYGTETGEMSLVGDEFYSRTSNSTPSLQSRGEDGEELLYIPHGVQIFFVTPEGQVSAPSYPGYLRLVKFTSDHSDRMPNRPPAFLQVCDWLYPLMAMDSPVLLCNTGVFMFPDMMAPAPGYYVGVVLSSELPAADRVLFQNLLSQMTDLRVQAPDEAAETVNLSQKVSIATPEEAAPAEAEEDKALPEWSEKVANGILTGASWLSWGLVKGAEFTGMAIHKGASKLREHITPEDKPTHVSPTVSKGLHVAKQATGGAVKVSQFLVDGVCTVAGCVGRELAPHVKKHGGKLIPESMRKDKDGRSNIDGAMVVAASGVQGFATMWTGLEVAAKNITTSVASETVTTVKHKFRGLQNVFDPPNEEKCNFS
ncbi:spartin b isoform X2 [Chaetodon trifascialis]|uniref:spartin b isoform X2 n=1 Tax=Chaetodon trifascialis TaxID=109706 RepID=UPI003994382F